MIFHHLDRDETNVFLILRVIYQEVVLCDFVVSSGATGYRQGT